MHPVTDPKSRYQFGTELHLMRAMLDLINLDLRFPQILNFCTRSGFQQQELNQKPNQVQSVERLGRSSQSEA